MTGGILSIYISLSNITEIGSVFSHTVAKNRWQQSEKRVLGLKIIQDSDLPVRSCCLTRNSLAYILAKTIGSYLNALADLI